CPYCSGSGVIKSSSTICYEILAEVKKLNMDLNGHSVVLRVNPDIARALKEEESGVLRDLQAALGRTINIRPDAHLHHEQFDLMAVGWRTDGGPWRQAGRSPCRLPASRPSGGEVNQVVVPAAVDPDADVVAALQHVDPVAAARGP